MSAYRLDPIDLTSDRWQVSELKELLFVGANSPFQARNLAALKTMKAQKVRPGEPLLMSPWLDDRITGCVFEPSRDDVPEGVVEDASGTEIADRI